MGSCESKSSGSKANAKSSTVVPADVTAVLVDAIKNHSAEKPAFDIIRANYTSDKPYSIDSFLSDKPTILSLACKETHDDLVVFLLDEMKANPNPRMHGTFGRPALCDLFFQSSRGEKCLAGAKALARAGADPNASGFGGETPYSRAVSSFKKAPYARDILMALATKDGTVTDPSQIAVPTCNLQNQNFTLDTFVDGSLYFHQANPLHYAVASENVIGALVMLELGVDPNAKTGDKKEMTALDILKHFKKYDQALYDTIQAVMDDPSSAKKATEIYEAKSGATDAQ